MEHQQSLLFTKISSLVKLDQAKELIKGYMHKSAPVIEEYERDTVLGYTEKTGQLETKFRITFCRKDFATIDGNIKSQKCTPSSFEKFKSAFDFIAEVMNSNYGSPYYSEIKCETYDALMKDKPSESMTTGHPCDRYEYIMQHNWKIRTDAASLQVIYDYYKEISLSFYYTVKEPFN